MFVQAGGVPPDPTLYVGPPAIALVVPLLAVPPTLGCPEPGSGDPLPVFGLPQPNSVIAINAKVAGAKKDRICCIANHTFC